MIVIPMAGESRRFREAGYDRPKYMLELDGRTLFDWSALSFASAFDSQPFLFIARDVQGTRDFIETRLRGLGVARFQIAILDAPTAGQAETVERGLDAAGVSDDEPLDIFNIDTFRPGMDLTPPPRAADGWLEVFRTPGDNWSFIRPSNSDPYLVAECVEKRRISDLCCTGLYAFARTALFREALAAERHKPSSHELFVAPMYNHLIAAGHRIGWREVPADDVILSGVPAEYEALKGHDLRTIYCRL